VLFSVLILGRIGIGITAQPEILDERVALFIITEILEGLKLLVGNDPPNVFVHPLLVLTVQLTPESLLLLHLLLISKPAFGGIGLLSYRRNLCNPIRRRRCGG
jgi:hypothetical protein